MEIGSSHGDNTRNLLEFCQWNEAKLHVIDPLPKYSVASWQERYGEYLTFHSALSLDAIPLIDQFDVVLIDGDHNWYTVFNELKLIERQCIKSSRPFPLVMLHDIAWPYGRRDLYYDPQTIPDDYRMLYEKKGVKPEITELLEDEGLNRGLFNASHEGDAHNGVLTAVEDFLSQTEYLVELTKVPGLHGLGILVPVQLKGENEDLAQILEALSPSPIVTQHIEQVERVRVEQLIQAENQQVLLQNLRERYEEALQRQKGLRARYDGLVKRHKELIRQSIRRDQRLYTSISAVLDSRQWKIASALGEIRSRLLPGPDKQAAPNPLAKAADELSAWRKALEDQAKDTADGKG